jgi:hypothetical protein
MADTSVKKIINICDKILNPLRGLSQNMIEQMFFNAR